MFYVINPLNELLWLLTVYRKCAQCPLHGGGGHFVGWKKRKQPFYGGQHQCLWNKSTSIRTWDTAEAWGASVPHISEVTRFLLNFRLNVNSAHKMAAPALLRWQIHCKCRMSPPAFERGEIKIKNTQMKNGRSLPTPEPVPYISIHNHIFRYLFNPMEKKKIYI